MTDNTQGLEDILDTLAEKSADSDSRLGYVDAYVFAQEAKQALTSLIKELVAEAKPEKKSTEDYGSWEEGHRNVGWNNCLEHYEQNLLKVLGYEDEK